jgi:predicted Zn-dependent protease
MLDKLFENLGRSVGSTVKKGKWFYQSLFGSEEEAIQAEYLVGKELAQNLVREIPVVKDPDLQAIIDNIGKILLSKLSETTHRFKLQVLATADVNAFALPGGFIFLTAGLLQRINSKDEIAFAIAHEISHVLLKHPMQRIVSDYSSQVISNIFLRGGVLGVMAKMVVMTFLKNSYSHEKELEADSEAVKLMRKSGFNSDGAKILLNRLSDNKMKTLTIFNYLSSHPSFESRISKIDSTTDKNHLQA